MVLFLMDANLRRFRKKVCPNLTHKGAGIWDRVQDIYDRLAGDPVRDIELLGAGTGILGIQDDGSGVSHSLRYVYHISKIQSVRMIQND